MGSQAPVTNPNFKPPAALPSGVPNIDTGRLITGSNFTPTNGAAAAQDPGYSTMPMGDGSGPSPRQFGPPPEWASILANRGNNQGGAGVAIGSAPQVPPVPAMAKMPPPGSAGSGLAPWATGLAGLAARRGAPGVAAPNYSGIPDRYLNPPAYRPYGVDRSGAPTAGAFGPSEMGSERNFRQYIPSVPYYRPQQDNGRF